MNDPAERWRRIDALCQAALQLTEPERHAFLQVNADDDDIRLEVQRLLNQESRVEGFLECPDAAASTLNPERMPLSGSTLNGLEVGAILGMGGMGEVYRARDTKLRRDVAVKVVRSHLTNDADHLARLSREARILATLNHPNVAQIYGLEDVGDIRLIVMELVEGPTLDVHLEQGPLAMDAALAIARQIAEALEAAHARGVIHRDLKPSNIKVRSDGTAKVLDFGLAKTVQDDGAHGASGSASRPLSRVGEIVGTAAYMSPEQARGQTVDHRTDLWSFGMVLYEMLTGHRPFQGETTADVIAATLTQKPLWSPLPTALPEQIRTLLTRCLKKDSGRRLDSASAALLHIAAAIEDLRQGQGDRSQSVQTIPPRQSRQRRPPSLRYSPLSFEPGGNEFAVWSPDGSAVAFSVQSKESGTQIYVRRLDATQGVRLTSMEHGATPVAWTTRGRIVFRSPAPPAGLWSVPEGGGQPEPLLSLKLDYVATDVARSESAVVYYDMEDGKTGLWISAPPGAPPIRYRSPIADSLLAVGNATVHFSQGGTRLLLMRNAGHGEEAWLLPFPENRRDRPKRIFDRTRPPSAGRPHFSWLPDDRHLVVSISAEAQPRRLFIADTESEAFTLLASGPTHMSRPAVSPDGTKLVFEERHTDFDIIQVDLRSGAVTPLVATGRSEEMPAWASAAERMAYVSDQSGHPAIWVHEPGRERHPVVTVEDFPAGTTQFFKAPAPSPDGARLIYARTTAVASRAHLWISAVSGGAPVRATTTSDAVAEQPGSWSSDGGWFVYLAARGSAVSLNRIRTGGYATPEVLVPCIDGLAHGSAVPSWSPSGDWILYQNNGWRLLSPDGQTDRDLSLKADVCAFSANGEELYYFRGEGWGGVLAVRPLFGGQERVIVHLSPEQSPAASSLPGLRLSSSPDGHQVTFSAAKRSSNLWLAEGLHGFARPRRRVAAETDASAE